MLKQRSLATLTVLAACGGAGTPTTGEPTYAGDVAAIVHRSCTPCHRPGQTAPFSLSSYDDVFKRRRQIARVTQRRLMPPWLPTHGEFVDDRSLDDESIDLIARWVDAGAPRGDAAAEPEAPQFTSGWQLREPDLVVTAPRAVTVPADGPDRFRNLVIPVDGVRTRFVEAVEIRPGSAAVHHAILNVDETRESRRLDALDEAPGFPGMYMGLSHPPDGHFIGWTPGKRARASAPGMAWRLGPGNDLVLQVHLTPTGKAESVRPQIGLFFTDTEPTVAMHNIVLYSRAIDIPAGEADYVVRDHLILPVAVTVHSVYPHAHYLCKTMEATAGSPDGRSTALFRIDAWDFDWQDDYRFRDPVELPAGTRIAFEYHYDNSAANPSNPSSPPKRVTFGQESFDEMGTLTLTVGLERDEHRFLLDEASARRDLEKRPRDWSVYLSLGIALRGSGRIGPAIEALRSALGLSPDHPQALCELGICLRQTGDVAAAEQAFRDAIRLDPEQSVARMHLGEILARSHRTRAAIEQFRRALAVHPHDRVLHNNLATAWFIEDELDSAAEHYRRALAIDPSYFNARFNLGRVLARQGRTEEARRELRAAEDLRPGDAGVAEALRNLPR